MGDVILSSPWSDNKTEMENLSARKELAGHASYVQSHPHNVNVEGRDL
jgi:hypothetical protein